MRIKNRNLFHAFVKRECRASEVIDYADKFLSSATMGAREIRLLDWIEANLYCVENATFDDSEEADSAISQLRLLAEGEELSSPEYLSERIKSAPQHRILGVLHVVAGLDDQYSDGGEIIRYSASLLDLHEDILRK